MARALGLYAVDAGSNPVLTSGLDLFPIFPPGFNSTTPVGVRNNFSVNYELFPSDC